MRKANYSYRIDDLIGRNCILITDHMNGEMSVADDIENVVKEIAAKEDLDPERYMILYKDKHQIWHGWDCKKSERVYLGQPYHVGAVSHFMRVQLQETFRPKEQAVTNILDGMVKRIDDTIAYLSDYRKQLTTAQNGI